MNIKEQLNKLEQAMTDVLVDRMNESDSDIFEHADPKLDDLRGQLQEIIDSIDNSDFIQCFSGVVTPSVGAKDDWADEVADDLNVNGLTHLNWGVHDDEIHFWNFDPDSHAILLKAAQSANAQIEYKHTQDND